MAGMLEKSPIEKKKHISSYGGFSSQVYVSFYWTVLIFSHFGGIQHNANM